LRAANDAFLQICKPLVGRCYAALVVGSTPRGWFYETSDLDIQVITENFMSDDFRYTNGVFDINITFIRVNDLTDYLRDAETSLQGLRLAAQMEQSIVIADHGLGIADFRRMNSALPLPVSILRYYKELSNIFFEALDVSGDPLHTYS